MGSSNSVLGNVRSGERARLIPVASDRQKESRAISALLGVFRLVPDYANMMLDEVGAPTNKRARLSAWTEVSFKSQSKVEKFDRPDGLLVVHSGKREWSALVEAKVKNQELGADQLERYLDLAREVNADAVITISNQFALLPSHHPVKVNKQKTRSVSLYHFSWLSLLSNAQVLSGSNEVEDAEQALILEELIRFLEHENSGVRTFERMGSEWRDLCAAIHQRAPLNKADEGVRRAVADWQQLCRYLALKLSSRLGETVTVAVKRKHAKDPAKRLEDDVADVVKHGVLSDTFRIPHAASDVSLSADLTRRNITLAIELRPPTDRQRATAAINWLMRQLDQEKSTEALIRCSWPGRTPDTVKPFEVVMENPKVLVPEGTSGLPTRIGVMRVVDLAGRFRGSRTLVEDVEKIFPAFYRDVGQHLRAWTPPPPQYNKNVAGKSRPPSGTTEPSAPELPERIEVSGNTHDDTTIQHSHERPDDWAEKRAESEHASSVASGEIEGKP